MIAKVESACLIGLDAHPVHVEVCLAKGLPRFSIVGLPDAAVREAKDRVVAAIRNSGFEFPSRRVTVNLAPAELKKEGSSFDLAIALGILLASEAVVPQAWPRCIWLGELALDGTLRPVRGLLPLARGLLRQNHSRLVFPAAHHSDVSYLDGLEGHPFRHLSEVVEWLTGAALPPALPKSRWETVETSADVDLAEIKGQALAKRALQIAVAGRHNLLFVGCPGTGKSLLARATPGLFPAWSLEEALDATQVHALTYASQHALLNERPFRSPHHSASSVAMIGGGDTPAPGEISLAHQGVLFLDELPEFHRDTLEALRQPLEEGVIQVCRARGRAEFPAQFLLVAAMNPCPCGYRGHPRRECVCTLPKIQKYLAKISGPLLDRIDLQVQLPTLDVHELFDEGKPAATSAEVRKKVESAWTIQRRRRLMGRTGAAFNAQLRGRDLMALCVLDTEAKQLLKSAVHRLHLSARAFDRLRRVARTIADLEGAEHVRSAHIAEAIQYRALDRPITS